MRHERREKRRSHCRLTGLLIALTFRTFSEFSTHSTREVIALGTFIREKQMTRYNCTYKEADLFGYSDEEQKMVRQSRRTKTRASPPKVKDFNDERSRKYFRWLFHNNFRAGDYMVTLTFANATNKKQSYREFTNYVKRLKRLYAKLGLKLRYLYVYEGKSKGTRPHFHIIVNSGKGLNRDDIERLWTAGRIRDSKRLTPDNGKSLCESLCTYLTKEKENASKFERSWNGSHNLLRPDDIVDDGRITKKRMRKIQEAARNDEVEKIVEQLYPGWELVSWYIGTNEITGRPFARFRLVRKQTNKRRKGKSP